MDCFFLREGVKIDGRRNIVNTTRGGVHSIACRWIRCIRRGRVLYLISDRATIYFSAVAQGSRVKSKNGRS